MIRGKGQRKAELEHHEFYEGESEWQSEAQGRLRSACREGAEDGLD